MDSWNRKALLIMMLFAVLCVAVPAICALSSRSPVGIFSVAPAAITPWLFNAKLPIKIGGSAAALALSLYVFWMFASSQPVL